VKKVESLRSTQKTGWEFEADKLAASNESDNTTITNFLSRRIFIRACMWHELAVVFHSRQAAQVTLGWRSWTKDQEEAQKMTSAIWEELGERLKSMPIE
jgi:sorting nexin-8